MEQSIQNYKLLHLINKGGMGRVYLAEHKLIEGKKAAIKLLNTELAEDEQFRSRFLKEAQTLSRLDHSNIVRLLDFGESDGFLYLIMEYVEGSSLDALIKQNGPINEERASKIMSKVLNAFQYAHSLNPAVIHRDIKPSNILIVGEEPKVIDFGIVKILEDKQKGQTQTITKIGTPMFMSPEQVLGKGIDQRSDIYSLGVTLYQMLTGTLPYDETLSDYEILTRIVNEPLLRRSEHSGKLSNRLAAVIKKATEKDKENRYGSCDEFRKSLEVEEREGFDDGRQIQGRGKEGRKAKIWVSLALISLLIISSFAYLYVKDQQKGNEKTPPISGGGQPTGPKKGPKVPPPASEAYHILNVTGGDYITLRNRFLTLDDYRVVNGGGAAAAALNKETILTNIYNGTRIKLLEEVGHMYRVNVHVEGRDLIGYIVKTFAGKPTILFVNNSKKD